MPGQIAYKSSDHRLPRLQGFLMRVDRKEPAKTEILHSRSFYPEASK